LLSFNNFIVKCKVTDDIVSVGQCRLACVKSTSGVSIDTRSRLNRLGLMFTYIFKREKLRY